MEQNDLSMAQLREEYISILEKIVHHYEQTKCNNEYDDLFYESLAKAKLFASNLTFIM